MHPDDASDRFAIYPMVEEAGATGVVAAVYAEALTRMPFVPSILKSLALCPPYLVLAWEQASGVLDEDGFADAAAALTAAARPAVTPPEDPQVRRTLAGFVGPLSRMLLLASGLLLAVRGDLTAPPSPGRARAPGPMEAQRSAPSQRGASAPRLYGEIRAALQTPMINTIWRRLAAQRQLESAWSVLGPQVAASLAAADALQRRALDVAGDLNWPVAATPAALAAAGAGDAGPGMAVVLEAYVRTLPRVLVLAASSSEA